MTAVSTPTSLPLPLPLAAKPQLRAPLCPCHPLQQPITSSNESNPAENPLSPAVCRQANLDLTFSSSTIKVPRGTSSGPIPHSATAGAAAPHSSVSAATTSASAAQLRPFSAPFTAPTQPGTSTQAMGGGVGAWRQGLGRPASALPRAAYTQGSAITMTTPAPQRQQRQHQHQQHQQQQRQERQHWFSTQARYSAAPVAGRSVQQAWAASDVAPFLMATQLVPERSRPGACARERSWAYADGRR